MLTSLYFLGVCMRKLVLSSIFALVSYTVDAQTCLNLKLKERTSGSLKCQTGQVISSIDFASYGTPTGECSTFKTSNCHASTSLSIVKSRCLNKTSCSLMANNSVFTDPCRGVSKRLYVKARCAAPTVVTPITPNKPPIINAGLDLSIKLPQNSVVINASASDPDGQIASYNWSKIAGPADGQMDGITTSKLSLNLLVAGTYQFELTVKDNAGASASDSVVLTVVPAEPINSNPPISSGGAGPTIQTFKSSGPIVATSGQVITGLHITNPNGPCITLQNASGVKIYNNKIGPCRGNAINAINVDSLSVTHNLMDNIATGLYVQDSSAGSITFEKNLAFNIKGPMPRGQIIQLNNVHGPGIIISCNISDQPVESCDPTQTPEDHINLYASSGTAGSPIKVSYNKLRGGCSTSGGGIMTGDKDGSDIIVNDNILVDPGQYGVAIAGGRNIKLLRNKVFSSKHAWTNVGAYVWNQYPYLCEGHEVRGNQINYINKNGVQNGFWNGANCGIITGIDENNFGDATITSSIWDKQIEACR